MNWKSIHEKAVLIGSNFKQSETALIEILQEVEREKVCLHLNVTSLFRYCVEFLKLTDDRSFTYIRIARASTKIPAIKEAIENKTLSISNAKKIAAVITPETQTVWLEKAQALSSRELDKEIIKTHPEKALPDKIKPVTESRFELRCGLSVEAEKLLKRAQDIIAKDVGRTLEEALREFVERHDPVLKAERALKRKQAPLVSKPVYKNSKRTAVPCALIHQSMKEAKGQCTHMSPQGVRCANRRYLHVHHCLPVSLGGRHELSNLRVLCSAHHRALHLDLTTNTK